jgi:hypothetical protein
MPKKISTRDARANLLIKLLVTRECLARNEAVYQTPLERANNERRYRADIAAAQFELEKGLIKTCGLDHLDGVERVYGIKRRIPSWERARKADPVASTQTAAA